MHLKMIPDEMARDIKSRAAKLGYSPSQYFVYLHMKDIGHHDQAEKGQPVQSRLNKKKKKRK